MKGNKILKYVEFIKEEMTDRSENYINSKLKQLKREIDDLFDDEKNDESEEPEVISKDMAKSNSKEKKLSMTDMGVRIDSSEISLYSKTDDNLKVKYSDDEGVYDLLISINIKDAIPKDPNGSFTEDDINKLYVKFKKYGIDNIDLIGFTDHNVTVSREDGKFMFSVPKKEETQQQGEQGQGQTPPEEEEGEKMNLMEFLEFLKSDFDERYGDSKKLDIETK